MQDWGVWALTAMALAGAVSAFLAGYFGYRRGHADGTREAVDGINAELEAFYRRQQADHYPRVVRRDPAEGDAQAGRWGDGDDGRD